MPVAVPGGVDLVILGATGFTGRLACEYMATKGPTDVRWAMAGRDVQKLRKLREELPERARDVPLLEVDVRDEAALQEMASGTKVVANYAGSPYIDKALPVVAACVEAGCCYVDITGEMVFMKESASRYDSRAHETGALIVHACGVDCIPSDLGAMLAAEALRKRHGADCEKLRLYVSTMKGAAVSGGTTHTILHMLTDGSREAAAAARDPYSLDPPLGQRGPDTGDFGEVSFLPHWDEGREAWTVPYVMGPLNARVVRRSNALLGYAWGKNMSYGEVMEVPGRLSGLGAVSGLAMGLGLLLFPPTRWALTKWVLPASGEGPSRAQQDAGFFSIKIVASGPRDENHEIPRVVANVESGDAGDPGYKCTARMSIEAALCCVLHRDRCYTPGGVVTTAVGFGNVLVEGLNASGMRLFVEP